MSDLTWATTEELVAELQKRENVSFAGVFETHANNGDRKGGMILATSPHMTFKRASSLLANASFYMATFAKGEDGPTY